MQQHRCDTHKVVSDDPETNPSTDAIGAAVATASEPMSTFEHTDSAFAPDTPALPTPKPSLPFMGAPRRCFAARLRQHNPPDAAGIRGGLVRGRRKAPITGGQVGRRPKMC